MSSKDDKARCGTPGPKPETLKIEGLTWEEAMRRALQVKRPADGWPDRTKRAATKKRAPR